MFSILVGKESSSRRHRRSKKHEIVKRFMTHQQDTAAVSDANISEVAHSANIVDDAPLPDKNDKKSKNEKSIVVNLLILILKESIRVNICTISETLIIFFFGTKQCESFERNVKFLAKIIVIV